MCESAKRVDPSGDDRDGPSGGRSRFKTGFRAIGSQSGSPTWLIILEQRSNLLRQGAIFVDPADDSDLPHLLFMLTHEIKSGDGKVLSKRLQFVKVAPGWLHVFRGLGSKQYQLGLG